MKKIKELIQQLKEQKKNINDFNQLETKTRADILQIAKNDIPIDVAKQKIQDARLTLDLVDAKRSRLEEPFNDLLEKLKSTLEESILLWNGEISQRVSTQRALLMELSLWAFEGDRAACTRWWDQNNINILPVFYTYSSAIYDTYLLSQQIQRQGAVQIAEHFLRHIERHQSIVKIDPETMGQKFNLSTFVQSVVVEQIKTMSPQFAEQAATNLGGNATARKVVKQ